jgi:hypothetical protein
MNRIPKVLLALGLLFVSHFGNAQDRDALNTVNRAAEQRMLSQRVAKAYAQLGLNVQPMAAKQEFDAAVARFEDNLKALELAASTDVQKQSLERLRKAWLPLRQAARGQPRRENAIWVAHQADEVLAAAEVHVRNAQSMQTGFAGRLVAQAGRQRMLSQRIAKAYLLISWGDTSEATREELDTAVNEFSGAMASLRARSENTAEIARELEEMSQHWEWLQSALAAEGASSYRLIVTEAAEAILVSADRVTRLYEKLSP